MEEKKEGREMMTVSTEYATLLPTAPLYSSCSEKKGKKKKNKSGTGVSPSYRYCVLRPDCLGQKKRGKKRGERGLGHAVATMSPFALMWLDDPGRREEGGQKNSRLPSSQFIRLR